MVQPEMRSSQRTVRQLALQNLIEVKLPDHRTAASVTDRQSGEMNFCQKKRKMSPPDACHPKRSSLRYQNERDALIVHGEYAKACMVVKPSLRRKCGIRKRARDIWCPRIVVHFSALLATNNIRIVQP